ncbi:unnamed protein product [Prunus armeniaca]|uniref:non-specific serine/threonine protein kinase n=1 Tax=Prunus armeniaca TaxID=36596 RepID=A0A6J5X1X8_PRUAR|nr:unnamed protein product [Prunus armeniaca]
MLFEALLVFFIVLFPFCTSIDTIAVNQHVKDGDFIVSKENNFELGFFSPGNSGSRYVGIWYANLSDKAVVWVANRNNPINDTSGVLAINSFDYPTDTLLPRMKVGLNWKIGLEWVLTSWKSQNDPGTGNYSLRLYSNQTATPQIFLYKGLTKYWRSDPGPWPNIGESLLTDYGILQQLRWNDAVNQWEELFAAPKYRCDRYGHCGANSKCSPDNINMFECECLPGYEPKSLNDWNRRDGSDGCVSKRIGVSNCGDGDGFVKVCLSNCSCTAYMGIQWEGRIDCLAWYGELWDILVYTELGRDLYVRVDKMGLAEYTRKSKGFLKSRGLLAIPMAAVALVLTTGFACWWLKKKRKMKDFVGADELEETRRNPEMQFFHLSAIIVATGNFSPVNKLGQGGFGTVYKGQLANDQKIAVKRLSKISGQGIEEFKNEVALIARLQHRNLVKLLGCCIKGEERMLVLEYLPNKSLDSFLFDHTRSSLLDWKKRFEIINGVARGILYLHQDSRLRIIHRDLKTSNVLLDAEMNPKISDFGMARIFHGDQLQDKTNRVVGTYGYMSPEYAVFGRYSTKSDVFSFGIILLEIVGGKKNNGSYQEDHSMNLIGHVWQLWREDRALEIVDSSLQSYHSDEVLRCIQVGLLCVQEDSEDRPTMSAVVFMLSGEASLPSPQQPAFVFRKSSRSGGYLSSSQGLYSVNDLTITKIDAR